MSPVITNPSKEDLIVCLIVISGEGIDERETEGWTNLLDRGGLWHINDKTHCLFYALDEQIHTTSAATDIQ